MMDSLQADSRGRVGSRLPWHGSTMNPWRSPGRTRREGPDTAAGGLSSMLEERDRGTQMPGTRPEQCAPLQKHRVLPHVVS